MSWRTEVERWALVELLTNGKLVRTAAQAKICDRLVEARWCVPAPRRDELMLDERSRAAIVALLARVFPEWEAQRDDLVNAGLPVSARGNKRLREMTRSATRVPHLPGTVNHKTAMAAVADHSKATLTRRRQEALDSVQLTHDGTIRMRPNAGLEIERGARRYDASELSDVLGEVIVTDRALLNGTCLRGTLPRAVLFVENLGSYVDLSAPPGFLVAYVPGWDITAARALMAQLAGCTFLQFGDLDPRGVEIMRALRRLNPALRWVVPDFWEEYEAQALTGPWPVELDLSDLPAIVQRLARSSRWLEQEPIAVDSRLERFLDALVA